MVRNNVSGRESAFRSGFCPDCYRGNTDIGPPAGRRPAGGPFGTFPVAVRPKSGPEGRLTAQKHYCVTQRNRGFSPLVKPLGVLILLELVLRPLGARRRKVPPHP